MGVDIYSCRLIEKVSDDVSSESFDKVFEEYDGVGKEILILDDKDEFISPFERGLYVFEGGKAWFSMSYGGYGEFLDSLRKIGDFCGDKRAYDTTLEMSGIDNAVSYEVASDMLSEFEKHYKDAYDFYHEKPYEYYDFLWDRYLEYMDVLRECVVNKGIIRYH